MIYQFQYMLTYCFHILHTFSVSGQYSVSFRVRVDNPLPRAHGRNEARLELCLAYTLITVSTTQCHCAKPSELWTLLDYRDVTVEDFWRKAHTWRETPSLTFTIDQPCRVRIEFHGSGFLRARDYDYLIVRYFPIPQRLARQTTGARKSLRQSIRRYRTKGHQCR
jgi:hypothetical protein